MINSFLNLLSFKTTWHISKKKALKISNYLRTGHERSVQLVCQGCLLFSHCQTILQLSLSSLCIFLNSSTFDAFINELDL